MRISIRRCLSMLRNTSDGNELAVPLPMPIQEHSVSCLYMVSGLKRVFGYYRESETTVIGPSPIAALIGRERSSSQYY